jgi:hypothetical protein
MHSPPPGDGPERPGTEPVAEDALPGAAEGAVRADHHIGVAGLYRIQDLAAERHVHALGKGGEQCRPGNKMQVRSAGGREQRVPGRSPQPGGAISGNVRPAVSAARGFGHADFAQGRQRGGPHPEHGAGRGQGWILLKHRHRPAVKLQGPCCAQATDSRTDDDGCSSHALRIQNRWMVLPSYPLPAELLVLPLQSFQDRLVRLDLLAVLSSEDTQHRVGRLLILRPNGVRRVGDADIAGECVGTCLGNAVMC